MSELANCPLVKCAGCQLSTSHAMHTGNAALQQTCLCVIHLPIKPSAH